MCSQQELQLHGWQGWIDRYSAVKIGYYRLSLTVAPTHITSAIFWTLRAPAHTVM